MTEQIPEAETFIRFRLGEMAERNEHHKFEEIATRIARKRISSNILIATGPVSAGGDQQRDAEFRHQAMSGKFADASRGLGIQHLGAKTLANWIVPVPPIAEQTAIVQRIGGLMVLVHSLRRRLAG